MVIGAGVEVMFYTRVVDSVCDNGTVVNVIVSGPDGLFPVAI